MSREERKILNMKSEGIEIEKDRCLGGILLRKEELQERLHILTMYYVRSLGICISKLYRDKQMDVVF